jgi:hypothetical protein
VRFQPLPTRHLKINFSYVHYAVAQLVEATSRKVAGSIPDGVIEIDIFFLICK